jgi:hypothetical protein
MLTIHFGCPLAFVVSNTPLAQDNYQEQRELAERVSHRSIIYQSQTILSSFFTELTNRQRMLLSLYSQNHVRMMNVNEQNIQTNNAHTFTEDILEQGLSLNTTENLPMWFAQGVNEEAQLTSEQ